MFLFLRAVACLACCGAAAAATHDTWKFDFDARTPAAGWTAVTPESRFSDEAGFGYEGAAAPPCFFSAAVPEGNYRVTVKLGDAHLATVTTIKSELRRLMIENVRTRTGEFVTRSFIVSVRTPRISEGVAVKLKPREQTSEMWNWDERITLEINGSNPGVRSIEIEPARDVPTLFIAGDSTSTDQGREPYNSWGQMLPRFFKPEIAVANHGESGESLRSFFGERRFDKVMSQLKRGDYVLIQFGHNDQKDKAEGAGAFTTYKAGLKRFTVAAQERGATVLLVTPMHRRTFDAGGHITNSLGDYPEAVRQAAKETGAPLIDLNAMSKLFYEALGPETSVKAFAPGDGTHHNPYGSYELARGIVEGIRTACPSLARLIAEDVGRFDPAHPDAIERFEIPPSPLSTSTKPYGN